MVSGFVTSPKDHDKISSGDATFNLIDAKFILLMLDDYFSISSTFRPKPFISETKTLNDSGK